MLFRSNPIYIKGFIKIYCKALGSSPDEYLKAYQQGPAKNMANAESLPILNPKPVDKVRFSFGKSFNLKKLLPRLVLLIIAALAIFLAVNLVRLAVKGVSYFVSRKTSAPRESIPRKAKKVKQKVLVSAPAVKSSKATVTKESSSSVRFPIAITMHAKKDTMVTLKADGKTIFQGVLAKNRSEYWQANEKLEFTVNDGGNIDLDYAGKNFSPLGKKGRALKNVVITKDGINIPTK